MIITILGKRWKLKRPRSLQGGEMGYCQAPDTPDKSIGVLASLRGEQELETLLHEMLHAADWHKDEEWIERVAADIARALTRLGYTREG